MNIQTNMLWFLDKLLFVKQVIIEDLLALLGYKDLRAVRKWCVDHNVLIVKQGKSEFVFETNFKEAFELPFINKLKAEFGAEWEKIYKMHQDNNVPGLLSSHENPTVHSITFKSNSDIISKYLSKYESHTKS